MPATSKPIPAPEASAPDSDSTKPLPENAPPCAQYAPRAQRLNELSILADRLAKELNEGKGDAALAEKFLEVSREAFRGSSMLELLREVEEEREENRVLMQVSMKLSSAGDLSEVLKAILDSLRHVVLFSAAGIFVFSQEMDKIELDMMVGYEGADRGKVHNKFKDGFVQDKGIVAHVLLSGTDLYVPDVTKDNRYVLIREQTRSELAVPIKIRDELIGVFNLESDDYDGFSEHDRRVLTAFASHAGVALERARSDRLRRKAQQIQEEFALARNIQRTFLPDTMPRFDPYDLGGMNFPSSEVGGDYFDFIPLTNTDMGIVMGDVAGHGVPAALMMANFRACLRVEAKSNYDIPVILSKVNEFLFETNRSGDYVTAFYGVLDRRTKVLTYSNAGHNPPILIRADGTLRELSEGGLLLGSFGNVRYEQVRLHLEPHDMIVFYTDGVTESQNSENVEFGKQRLIESALKYRDLTALEIVRRICHDVHLYRAQDSIQDDLTLSVIKYVLPA
ncbi:SpoIIE family protein phosphatase [bacterium]|nr:SpoIIE family protein phosphatase [bacterium]